MRKWLDRRLTDLKEKGKSKTGLAKALGVNKNRITEMIKGTRDIGGDEVRPLARYLEWPEQTILDFIEGGPLRKVRLGYIMVRGAVEAGAFGTAMEWEQADWRTAPVSADARFPEAKQFGLEVRGPSMNKIYPEGSVVVCVKIIDFTEPVIPPKRVIVQRRTPDGVEATIKELELGDSGDLWLWPRSTHPDFQQPWKMPKPDEYDASDDLEIVAVVVGSYKPE